jgi:hypothetical protein
MAEQDGVPVQLEEAQQLLLPFLFPQDGYLVGKEKRRKTGRICSIYKHCELNFRNAKRSSPRNGLLYNLPPGKR